MWEVIGVSKMLKKINVQQLTLGMHIKEFCGSWMDHPFWRSGFVLADPKDIESIRASKIRELWIDSAKGCDVRQGEHTLSETESEKQVEEEIAQFAQEGHLIERVSISEEFERASKICAKSKQAITSMFHEARMGKAIAVKDVSKVVEEISASVARNPDALISIARLKTADDYTYMHSVAVCALMMTLSRQLGLDDSEIRLAGISGMLHDLGKMMIPKEILNKPGKLTEDEFDIIKTHPAEGCKLLIGGTGEQAVIMDVVMHHHEKIDGTGYPEILRAEEISIYARMGAVCDVYDAITSNRPYKSGWDPAESLRRMAEWAGHFDPKVFQAFVKSLGIYPTGSLVRLNSGRLGVVIEQSKKSLLMPLVKVFFSTRSGTHVRPELIDLSRPGCPEKIVAREDPAKWKFINLHELWSEGAPAS